MCDDVRVLSRLGESVYMNNISRSLNHDYPDLITPQTQLQQTKQPARTQIEIWTEFWRDLPAGPFYINQNKYRCINASSDWRAGEMEISEYQILSREGNISQ